MKHQKHKGFRVVALLFILLLTLSACSGRQNDSNSSESSAPAVSGRQDESASPEKSESVSGGQKESASPESGEPVSDGQSESNPSGDNEPVTGVQDESGSPNNSESAPEKQAETGQPEEPDAAANEAILYIGTRDSGFTEYSMTYEGSLTPEILIAGIADLTGWDMTLAEEVTTGKGGMSVCFADSSALFVGPPEPQNEEFFMFSAEQLAQTLLDSTQKTLQMGFIGEGGDPDALDIYYYMEGEKPLELPDVGREWPLDQPYKW